MESRLMLEFRACPDSAATTLQVKEMSPPWKVVRGFPLAGGAASVHLNNVSGGILGGDNLSLKVHVHTSARAQITSTGATRIYRCRAGAHPARSAACIRVDDQGLLEFIPDPVIPFAGSRYIQRTQIHLGPGAGLFWWDIVTAGRTSAGERFAYDLFESHFEIVAGCRPIALENFRIEPARTPPCSPVRLHHFTHLANFYICRQGVPPREWLHYEETLNALAAELTRPGDMIWGATALASDGLVVRGLSNSGRNIPAALLGFWRAAKQMLYGQDPVVPRKIY